MTAQAMLVAVFFLAGGKQVSKHFFGLVAMKLDTHEKQFPPLESVTSPTVGNAAAAYYLNRRPQTLRWWACLENGPLRPIRINRRLAWPVAELRRVLGVAA